MSGAPFRLCSRWIILPGDPEPLKAWLRAKAAAEEHFEDQEDSR